MKITRSQLKQIIKEELGKALNEASGRPRPGQPMVPCEDQPNSKRYTKPTIVIGDYTLEWKGRKTSKYRDEDYHTATFMINGEEEEIIDHESAGKSPVGPSAALQLGASYPEIDTLDLECWVTKMFEIEDRSATYSIGWGADDEWVRHEED
jgi:hypothetical protein